MPRFFYAVVALVFISGLFVCALMFRIESYVITPYLAMTFLAISGVLARRIALKRIGLGLEGIALLYGQGLAMLFWYFPIMATSLPFVDAQLAHVDAALGFSWLAYADASRPWSYPLLVLYRSFNWQPGIIIIALAMTGQRHRLRQFIGAAFLALAIGTVIFAFTPALGAARFYGVDQADYFAGNLWAFADPIVAVHHGQRVIDDNLFTGFVSFPSYHAASAIILAWAAWGVRWLRYPFLALNVGMLLAVPYIGSHYFVDVLAGIVIAAIAIRIMRLGQLGARQPVIPVTQMAGAFPLGPPGAAPLNVAGAPDEKVPV